MTFQAFRDRYPDAQIISDLLLVDRDRFVVKVTITTTSAGTASGLAAHTAIEVAEDQARLRAIAALGYVAIAPADSDSAPPPERLPPLSSLDSEGTQGPNSTNEAPLNPLLSSPQTPASAPSSPPLQSVTPVEATETETTQSSNGRPEKPKPSPPKPAKVVNTSQRVERIRPQPEEIEPPPASLDDDDVNLDGDDFDETSAPIEASLPLPEPPPEADNSPIPAEALPAPINLSDVIAQTDIELRRLGWSVETGRDYLEQTYQKRSRHELSEEELIQFLCHLEAL